MDHVKFLPNSFYNVLRPQQKVIDEELLVLVDKLGPDSRPRIEA
jgi:hypothetical protein